MGSIRDKNIGWLRKRIYLPVTGFPGYNVDALITGGQAAGTAVQIIPDSAAAVIGKTTATNFNAAGATAAADQNIRQRAIANGQPRLVAVASASVDVQGLLLAAANNGVEYFGMIPFDLDPSKEIGLRCWWSHGAAAVTTRTITFRVQYGKVGANATIPAVTTALNTLITAQAPVGVVATLQRGNRGIINADQVVSTDFFWGFEVVMSAFDAAFTEAKYLLGLEIDYMPRKTYGPGRLLNSAVLTSPFDLAVVE